jgi:hypothetical protein
MHWKETDRTGPAEVLGRYPITTTVPEAIKHTGAVRPIAEPIEALLQEPLLIEVALLQGLPTVPIGAQLQQGPLAETTEAAPVVPQQDHRAAPIEVRAVPAVPVAA